MNAASRKTLFQHAPTVIVSACCVFLDVWLLLLVIQARTSLPLVSPWDVLPSYIFVLFASATTLLVIGACVLPRVLQLSLFLLHTFVACSVVTIMYRLGFGFDPFLHQAAEQHLARYHSINLPTPLYVGQYALVWLIHAVSRLPVILIDRWLVPVLSLGLIPLLQRTRRLLPIALFLIPVSWFSFTIPFQLGLLFFICALCLASLPFTQRTALCMSGCAIASLLIHPLIGLPCTLFIGAALIEQTRWKKWSKIILIIGVPLTLVAAMMAYATLQHATLTLPSLIQIQGSFLALFGTTYRFTSGAIGLSLLYSFLSFWPLALCLIGLKENLQEPAPWNQLRRSLAFGILFSAILLACFVRLPNIIAYEQFEFPLRLLQIIPLLFLPDLAQLVERKINVTWQKRRWISLGFALIVGLIATSQWFVSYPQHNAIAHGYAPSISEHEFNALRWIETQQQGKPYLVLSHQMLAAAAIQTSGFEQTLTTCHGTHLRYAIPTGGALYQDFLQLLRTDQPELLLKKLHACYGQLALFVAFPNSWDLTQRIDHALAPLAEAQTREGGYLRVYKLW